MLYTASHKHAGLSFGGISHWKPGMHAVQPHVKFSVGIGNDAIQLISTTVSDNNRLNPWFPVGHGHFSHDLTPFKCTRLP